MPPPTIQGALKVQDPVFIRKLARPVHWAGKAEDSLDQRVKEAVKNVFRNQTEQEISIYRVSSDEELRRVAIGMNANRDSLSESLAFAVLRPEELAEFGIQFTQTPGDLECEFANRLHLATATDQQLEIPCRKLMAAGRTEGRCTSGMMKSAAEMAVAEGCSAATNVTPCRVTACATPPDPSPAGPSTPADPELEA